MEELLQISLVGTIQLIQLNHQKRQNPMSEDLRCSLINALRDADVSNQVSAIVLSGGDDRDFCVGGDFSEVSVMERQQDIEAWVDGAISLYQTILSVSKPVVAAISGYAIGYGFQLALCCDWRIGSDECTFLMWEIKKGISCPVGSYILEKTVGRSQMMHFVVGCDEIKVKDALAIRLLNEVVDKKSILSSAIKKANELSMYHHVPFRTSKAIINATFIEGLDRIRSVSKTAHFQSFQSKAAQSHFNKIIKKTTALSDS